MMFEFLVFAVAGAIVMVVGISVGLILGLKLAIKTIKVRCEERLTPNELEQFGLLLIKGLG